MATEQLELCQTIQQNIKTLEAMCLTVKGYFDEKSDQKKEQQTKNLIDIDKPCENKLKEQDELKFRGVTIRKNEKCNTWYTRVRIDNKQLYISGKTQTDCMKQLKAIIKNGNKEEEKNPTLIGWYDKWFELFKKNKVKETTIDDYKKVLKKIPTDLLNKKINKITNLEIIILLNSIEAERMKQKVYELLNTLFEKAVDFDLIKKNILKQIEKPKHIVEKGVALNISEQATFIQGCKNYKWGNLFLTILYQGLRIGEALALTLTDVDFEKETLNINKAINEKGQLTETKNTQSTRIMPLFKPTQTILKTIQTNNRIFNFSYTTATKRLKELLQHLNLKEISLHDLRHTFITNCKNAGIPEHIVQNWVGHQIGSKVTSTVYTHITEDANLFNINKLNETKFYSNSTQE